MAVVHNVPKTVAQLKGDAVSWATQNGDWVKTIIGKHRTWITDNKIPELQKAYDGKLTSVEIRDRAKGDDVNNKLQASYTQLVIDTPVDYLLGKPITWTVEDPTATAPKEFVQEYRDVLLNLLETEEAQRVLAELMRQGGIAGYSGIVVWVDEDGKIDCDEFPVQEFIPVYDTRGRLRVVIRAYEIEVTEGGNTITKTKAEVYDDQYVTYLISDAGGNSYEFDTDEAETGNPVQHNAGRIPVAVYVNGTPADYDKRKQRAGVSDLENGVLSLIENYAHSMSDKANWTTYAMDQYLRLTGVDVDENEVLRMRKARALALKNENGSADFIAPQMDDEGVENHLKRTRDTIYDMAQMPKLGEVQGAATATEIKTKYAALDIRAGKKELYFTGSVKQLIAVLTDMLNAKRLVEAGVDKNVVWDILRGKKEPPAGTALYNPDWVAITLNRNQPQNNLETAQIVQTLSGIVPDSYLYELLWFVPDPQAALEEMKQQKADAAKQALEAMGMGGNFGDTNTPPNGGDNAGGGAGA